MGRKSNRDLWTAKLAGNLGVGASGAVGGNGSAARASGRSGVGSVLTQGATVAAQGGSVVAQSPAVVTQAAAAQSTLAPLAAAQSVLAVRSKSAAAQRVAQAAVGVRRPFHGVVLGIDPSLRGTGIAVVRFSPPEQPRLLFSITVRNKPALTPAQCLGNIARAVSEAIETYRPQCVSLEQTVYVQNVKTSLILGSARGAAIAPAAMQGLEIFEYAPTRLKQAVVGSGRASKEQVAAMVRSLVQAGRDLLSSDEADAAAAAICHAFTTRG